MARRKKQRRPKIITVKSKAYGDHKRAARGTYKEAPINDTLEGYKRLTNAINKLCKVIKDSFDPFRENIKETTFWSRLISFFKKQRAKTNTINWPTFKDFEFVKYHKLDSVLNWKVEIRLLKAGKKQLSISIDSGIPNLVKNEIADAYRQTFVALFLTKTYRPKVLSDVVIFSPELKNNGRHFEWTVPRSATIMVLALKCELLRKGNFIYPKNMRGMDIIGTAEIRSLTTDTPLIFVPPDDLDEPIEYGISN